MMDNPMLADPEKINELARILARYECVSRHDQRDEVEAGTLASGFSDLEKAFRRILQELLPKMIVGKLSEREALDVLLLIGDEFRHIDYHLRDNRFYSYLWPNAPSDRSLP